MKYFPAIALLLFGFSRLQLNQSSNFFPHNFIAAQRSQDGGLSREQFKQVTDELIAIYIPLLQEKGIDLKVERRWNDDSIDASVNRDLDNHQKFKLTITGGMGRQNGMTKDSLALVMCHEFSHILTGLPYAEGQADYLAVSKCLRRYWKDSDNQKAMIGINIPQTLSKACKNVWGHDSNYWMCLRTSITGLTMAKILAGDQYPEPRFENPDKTVVQQLLSKHPSPQCRLDTYFQASLCTVGYEEEVDHDSEVDGTCHEVLGHRIGLRPRCWFKSGL